MNPNPFGEMTPEQWKVMQERARVLSEQRAMQNLDLSDPPPQGPAPQQSEDMGAFRSMMAPVPSHQEPGLLSRLGGAAGALMSPGAGQGPPPQAAPEGPPGTPQSPNLVTGASPQGAPAMQGPGGPGLSLQSVVPGHAQGLSPADRAYQHSLGEQGMQGMLVDENSMARQRAIAEKQAADSAAINASEQQGLLSFQESQKRDAERQAQFERETKQQQTKITRQIDELQAQGIDPNHYWQNTSTAGKIAAGIAVGLGGFAAGLNPHLGGHNAALEIINGAIERDIDAQKTNLQKSMGLLKSRMELNGQSFDEQAALNRAERDSVLTAYTVASNSLAKQAANNNGSADFQQRSAALEQGLQKSKMDRVASLAHENYVLSKNAERIVGGAGGGIMVKVRTPDGQDVNVPLDKVKELVAAGILPDSSLEGLVKKAGLEKTQAETAKLKGEMGGTGPADTLKGMAGKVGPDGQPASMSTNWEPQRNIQGTGAHEKLLQQDTWNANARAALLKAKYSPRAVENMVKDFLIQPGDSDETIRERQRGLFAVLRSGAAPADPEGMAEGP